MFNKLFSEMNLNPQIFLFWFSLVKVGGGWWWNSDEVNISNKIKLGSHLSFYIFNISHHVIKFSLFSLD